MGRVGAGGQGRCERRSEVKGGDVGLGGVRVDVNGEVKFM